MLVGFDHITRLLRGGGGEKKSSGGVNPKRFPPAVSMKAKLQTEITLPELRGDEKTWLDQGTSQFLGIGQKLYLF